MIRVMVCIAILICSPSCIQQEGPVGSQPEGCTREVLQTAVDSYIAAQEAGDSSKMLLASQVKYTENWKEIQREEGLWNTPLPVAFHRSIFDVESCKTFTEVIVNEGDSPHVIGTRLKVDNGQISEMESLYTKEGDWLFNADNYLKYSTAEDWRILEPGERVSRQALVDAGDSYFDHFSDSTVEIPFGIPCARLEGGIYTAREFDDPNASCDIGFPVDKLPMLERSYVVDEDMGTVNIFLLFGNPPGAPDSHTFRLDNGKIRYIHTLTLTVPGVDSSEIMGRQPEPKPKTPANAE